MKDGTIRIRSFEAKVKEPRPLVPENEYLSSPSPSTRPQYCYHHHHRCLLVCSIKTSLRARVIETPPRENTTAINAQQADHPKFPKT